jgi:phage baseplate assembly protein gpV
MRQEMQLAPLAGAGVLEPAEVVWRGDPSTEVRVRIERDSCTRPARPALPGDRLPDVGDRVLVAADSGGDLWILAAISASPSVAPSDQSEVREPGGATAAVEPGESGSRIVVRDRRGALLFEYDPETRTTTLHTLDGDLDVDVPQGALNLRASQGVRIDSGARVEVNGSGGVNLRSRPAGEGAETRIDVRPDGLGVAAETTEVAAGTVRFDAARVVSRMEKALAIYGTLEITADRIRQRTRRLLTAVEKLFHLSAGRVEADVDDDLRLRSGTATMKAKGRVKIDGDSIHLG